MLEGFEIGRDKPHLATFAIEAFEHIAELLIHGVEVFYLDTLAVGRVCDNHAASLGRLLVFERAVEEHHVFVEFGELEVFLGLLEDAVVDVVAPYLIVEVGGSDFAVFLVEDGFPVAEVELFPAFEAETAATIVLGGYVVGEHGGFDKDGA